MTNDLSPDLQRRVENAYRKTDGLQEGAPPFDKLTPLSRKRFEDQALMWFAALVPELAAITPQYWLAPVEPTEGMSRAGHHRLIFGAYDASEPKQIWGAMRQAHMKEQEKE